MTENSTSFPSFFPNRIILLSVLLAILAAIPRLYHLGELGFYMDEETTAFAARAMAEGKEPQMPSGMPYYRSLPHTWLSSISARIFGLNNEFSYRLPGALIGVFTVPLVFVLARPYVGTSVAFLAALLLAFSEWHIITSRQARMYTPFLFFYIACVFSILRWVKIDEIKYFITAAALFVITASLHNLGVLAAFIPLTALFIRGYARTAYYKLVLFSIIGGGTAFLYGKYFVNSPYKSWKEIHGIQTIATEPGSSLIHFLPQDGILIATYIIGFLTGLWLGRKSKFPDMENGKEFRTITRYLLAIIAGLFAASGHLHGTFLSILLLMFLYPDSMTGLLKQASKPLIAIGILAAATTAVAVKNLGLVAGIKSLVTFPYPNWLILNGISTGATLLYISALLYLSLRKKSPDDNNVLVLALAGLLPLIIVGMLKKWAAARYLIEAYPFILISCAFALHVFIKNVLNYFSIKTKAPVIASSYFIGLSGILGGHGLMQAYMAGTVDYGDRLNKAALIFPFYPDHKYPGEFVAGHSMPGDLIVAEDVLEQRWYAGKVNYWLRNYDSHKKFMYIGTDQHLYDIYVNSIAVTPDILDALMKNKQQRIWVITSGETYYQRRASLKNEQRLWLENIEKTYAPIFTGKDRITNVYCLNCNAVNQVR